MQQMPRIAVGTVQRGADHQPLLWALMDQLERFGPHVQPFLSQARFAMHDAASAITGQGYRHLDSWLMSPEICLDVFCHGTRPIDLAIVEGQYDAVRDEETGGSLDTLCGWLDLPRIVVLDASRLADCQIPRRPARVDAVLLDCVADRADACRWQTTMEALWGVPVLGSLDRQETIRKQIDQLPAGTKPSLELCRALGDALGNSLQCSRLLRMAAARPLPSISNQLFRRPFAPVALNVAVAIDDAFHCYFPDTLDLLEVQGATIHEFSPLHDDRLPSRTDLVYFPCGRTDCFAEELSNNHCMRESLRSFVAAGGRIYAEGGGLAYLARKLILDEGRQYSMTGILPVMAARAPLMTAPRPVEVTLSEDVWLGRAGSTLRGYLNSNWQLEPTRPQRHFIGSPPHQHDLIGSRQAIGSRVHLNFAAQPSFVRNFFQPIPDAAKNRSPLISCNDRLCLSGVICKECHSGYPPRLTVFSNLQFKSASTLSGRGTICEFSRRFPCTWGFSSFAPTRDARETLSNVLGVTPCRRPRACRSDWERHRR